MPYDTKWKKEDKLDYIGQAVDILLTQLTGDPEAAQKLQDAAKRIDAASAKVEDATSTLNTLGT